MQLAKHTLLLCCLALWENIQAVLNNGYGVKSFARNYNHHQDRTINKVSFTQRGYIQFLRYITDVPPMRDYTFCIWVRSHNLTYAHPLLSYSKHEEERLIRVWISPQGTYINLEILEFPIFKIPVQIVENHWYHICQSWSSSYGSWNFYLNGKLHSSGYEPQLRGVRIKGGGDIVVGQEYTDFDKGLDDGIEGDVFGFNFVLSPTSYASRDHFHLRRHYANDIPHVLGYFPIEPNRKPKTFLDVFNTHQVIMVYPNAKYNQRRILNDIEDYKPKPTGLKLVEQSYNCALGKGAPVSGKDVLVSWTKTPVRVFGGAILKTIPPFCT